MVEILPPVLGRHSNELLSPLFSPFPAPTEKSFCYEIAKNAMRFRRKNDASEKPVANIATRSPPLERSEQETMKTVFVLSTFIEEQKKRTGQFGTSKWESKKNTHQNGRDSSTRFGKTL
ncbi:hypothetical protein CDAR_269431 [Caerostris darwini]|uniref:Uncharacterized protein n=1 Tax=Caerostris darwini TaxID=1538125 RepID=A0AAV4VQN6_9ARAC|nr:hypothetical protein CDAR_269431 [Caerostris darwini]